MRVVLLDLIGRCGHLEGVNAGVVVLPIHRAQQQQRCPCSRGGRTRAWQQPSPASWLRSPATSSHEAATSSPLCRSVWSLSLMNDPQALNDFLYGTNELQTEDLLINSSSGGGSLFTDAPSPGSLLGDGSDPPDSPPPGCVDLSFLEEALLSSPEGEEDPEEELGGGTPVQTGYEGKKGGVQCDILQQSLQEAQITEQTMALDPGGDNLSLYSPPFIPRDTQAAVDPPQPSLLAVGPGCPSLKPAAQLMGLLPGNVFPETFSLSSMILHRAVPRPLLPPRHLPTPLLRAPVPLLIQSKLPVSIQPRLVQISPKPPGQKQNQAPKACGPPGPPAAPLPKQLSLQLVNPGSFLLQPHIFQGQNQYLLQGRAPVTISQHAARPLLGSSAGGPQILTVPPASTPQILTVPPRQLNFSFTSPAGQLALRQVLSGPLQLQSGAPTVFQMPGAYAAGGPRTTLVHGPALGNHITLINSSGVLPPDLTSISIVNGPSVVQGRPFAARAPALQTEGPLSRQQASVVLLPERAVQEERGPEEMGPEETLQQILQVLQPVTVQPPPAELQSPPPPAITVLQPPSEAPLPPHPAEEKLLMPPIDVTTLEEEATPLMSQNEAFIQHLQQAALSPPLSSELLAADLPMETLSSPDRETPPQSQDPAVQNLEASPIHLDPEDTSLSLPPSPLQDAEMQSFSPLIAPQSSDHIQIHVSQASFPQNQLQVQSSVSQPPSPPQPNPPSSGLSTGGDPPPVQQHTQHKPTAALLVEPEAFPLQPSSPAAWGHGQGQGQGPPEPRERTPTLRSLQTCTKIFHRERISHQQHAGTGPSLSHLVFQQRLCSDQASVQASLSGPAFPSLQDAVSRLLPFHCCAGELPTQQHFNTVDQEFETVSGFLLKRTKDMVNKYRQLLVREAQQESPSAEMVMLERLFLQAERCALVEDRRRVRRDPESFLSAMTPSSSSLPPSSPPASWPRLSDRPPGLKTYRSSSRGALRLTIKHESGSRKVVHNSACEQGLKRDHKGQLTNGGPHPLLPGPHPPLLGPHPPLLAPQETPNGAHPPEDISDTDSKLKPLPTPQIKGSPHREVSAPKVKCSRPDAPTPRPLQEDPLLNEHLQSAIDSILELQRLQGPSGAPPSGPCLDQGVSSALEL
ncbi:hypothetical protein NQZ68_022417 [Dissostichus eleginoides]|nr:hypothetical protein NQZ68_022417 [Dissostichus eleginoides]